MPKILSYTPRWLSRPSPGFDAFRQSQRKAPNPKLHSSKTIACNGSDVFIASENELRWTNLSLLKADWESRHSYGDQSPPESHSGLHRRVTVPAYYNIEQLVVSPTGEFLAILTSHTVWVTRLPDFSQYKIDDPTPTQPKTTQVGPGVHVMERSPLVAALWHPVAKRGSALVTVTEDGSIRMWELNWRNRWSFAEPTKAFNLNKLSQASFATADLTPPNSNAAKTSKLDTDIQVASACFGGTGGSDEKLWSSMTLWIASKKGNLYALCPLLPARWIVPPSSILDLGASIAARSSALDEQMESSLEDAEELREQLAWISEILETAELQHDETFDSQVTEIYRTPSIPSSVPKLQGPFKMVPHLDVALRVSDMLVVPATPQSTSNEPEDEEDFHDSPETKSPVDVICLTSEKGELHVLADPLGVEGQWLPFANLTPSRSEDGNHPAHELIRLESLHIIDADIDCRPTFTPDPASPNSFYITQQYGVSHASLSRWTRSLDEETSVDPDSGSEFRIPLLVDSSRVELNPVISFRNIMAQEDQPQATSVATCVAFDNEDLGRFVVTADNDQPHAVELAPAGSAPEGAADGEVDEDGVPEHEFLPYRHSANRATFYPPEYLYSDLQIPPLPQRQRREFSSKGLYQEKNKFHTNLVPAISEAHRVVMDDKKELEEAAGAITSRCQGLLEDLVSQVEMADYTAMKVDQAVGDDADVYDEGSQPEQQQDEMIALEEKLESAKQRQEDLAGRFAELRERVAAVQGRPVNEKERQWMSEVETMARGISVDVSGDEDDTDARAGSPSKEALIQRLQSVQHLKDQLVTQQHQQHPEKEASAGSPSAGNMSEQRQKSRSPSTASPQRMSLRSNESKKMFTSQISHMLERETVMIEAMREKLETLGIDIGRGATDSKVAFSPGEGR